jgi:hypothetical protein
MMVPVPAAVVIALLIGFVCGVLSVGIGTR